jgi:hypothetical protein
MERWGLQTQVMQHLLVQVLAVLEHMQDLAVPAKPAW